MAATAARRQAGRPRGSRRAEIIEAGLRLFASRGFERTTMADVAAELGIGAPALYYWFPAKESLLFACLEQVMAQLNAALAEALETCPPARDPVAALRALVEAHGDGCADRRDAARAARGNCRRCRGRARGMDRARPLHQPPDS
ncbi:TetR/AcrR family transcriptional regulator [Leptolyngbya sp. 15MV]|nr:TetR/AcrR family transcriptional regulator [Leptolyngbya sp. 15MV]